MIKKVAKILTWLGIAAWFVVMMAFVSDESEGVICNRIEVVLQDTVNNRFVTRGEVLAMIESSGLETRGYPLSQINTRDLEQLLEKNSLYQECGGEQGCFRQAGGDRGTKGSPGSNPAYRQQGLLS